MANVATRLFSIIFLLQSRGTLKATELAGELGVSERTVHRYMGMLDEMGIPIYTPGVEDSTLGNMFCAYVMRGKIKNEKTKNKTQTKNLENKP